VTDPDALLRVPAIPLPPRLLQAWGVMPAGGARRKRAGGGYGIFLRALVWMNMGLIGPFIS
jgi:hypothetical protein